jgi:hypothetical protein
MMAVASTVPHRVTSFDGRIVSRGARRRAASGVALGLGVAGTAGGAIIAATLAAAWIVSVGLSGNPSIHSRASAGPGALAIAQYRPPVPNASAHVQHGSRPAGMTFASRWTDVTAAAPVNSGHAPNLKQVAALMPPAAPEKPKPAATRSDRVPLPRPHPARLEAALPPAGRPAPQLASASAEPVVTGSIPSDPTPPPRNKPMTLPGPENRTAVYDIATGTVHMPNGEKLEAHSGLGDKMDDPRFVHVRMRGATPPNVYDLKLRESLFHGVRAIRLNPVDEDKMFGRDGILAHSYMLGSNGQSNGCVSFKDYPKFLNAFLKGEVDRMVVVANLNNAPLGVTPIRTARATKVRRWHVADTSVTAARAKPSIDQW